MRTENKMKRLVIVTAFLLGALPFSLSAQPLVKIATETKSATLMSAYDLDGEAADADQLITAALGVIVSETDYTASIVAQADSCRLHDITISDTDMGVGEGAITVVGTDCLGYTKTCAWSAWTAGDDDGVKTLVCTDGKGAYFRTVTSITTGVMTAAATDEYFLLGYTSNSENTLVMYGKLNDPGPSGEHSVNPFGSYSEAKRITTAGVLTTTIDSVAANGAFTNVVAGDLISFGLGTVTYELRVVTRTSADEIVVHKAVKIPASGQTFTFKHLYVSTDPTDELWVPVDGWKSAAFTWSIDANADTGGVVASLQCLPNRGPRSPSGEWVEIGPGDVNCTIAVPTCTVTTASAAVQTPFMKAITLDEAPFSFCRFGVKFATGDDADAANESINVSVQLGR